MLQGQQPHMPQGQQLSLFSGYMGDSKKKRCLFSSKGAAEADVSGLSAHVDVAFRLPPWKNPTMLAAVWFFFLGSKLEEMQEHLQETFKKKNGFNELTELGRKKTVRE